VPALVIPLWNVLGERAGAQLRPDTPRMLDGKPAKYETRAGQKMLLDVPPRVRPHLGDPARPLVITEGPIKADAAVSAGLDCVALLGVWSWRGRNDDGGKVALPDWDLVALNGRRVLVAFDSDVMLKAQVHQALGRLGRFLALRGADVAYAYLPHGDAGSKVGLDDWLAAGNPGTGLFDLATTELRKPPAEPAAEQADMFDDVEAEPGHRVLDDVVAFLDRYVAWQMPEQRDAVALWAAHTHAIGAFDSTPRLDLSSAEKQCGKTRTLELLESLCRRPRLTVSMTPAYMFRLIEEATPTLLVDETDAIFGPKADKNNEDLRGLLNAGHRRGATVGRMVGEGAAMTPTDFPVFCPVALAGIGKLPDTIHDRSIVVELRRRSPDEYVEPYRARKVRPTGLTLGRRLAAWAHRNADALADVDPPMPAGITDRPADVWEPILAVADAAGGSWPDRARAACIRLNEVRAESDDSIGVRLLADIREVFTADRTSSADLAEKLAAIEESPWGDWRGKAIDARWLARRLKPYGVRPAKVRIGETTAQGYRVEDFHDTWSRYVPTSPETSGTSGTGGTPQVATTRDVPDVPGVPLPAGGNGSHEGPPMAPCNVCGEEMVISARDRPCAMTPGCRGRHVRPAA
jgi:hypothetical protein